jgi:hypothetical protein
MVQHQVVLMCRKLTRMQSGVNLPLSEVIMSRRSWKLNMREEFGVLPEKE